MSWTGRGCLTATCITKLAKGGTSDSTVIMATSGHRRAETLLFYNRHSEEQRQRRAAILDDDDLDLDDVDKAIALATPDKLMAFGAASSATACTRISPYGSRQLKRYTSRANELCWSNLLWLHFPFFKLLRDRDFRLPAQVALLVWISMTNHPPFSCSLYLLK